MDSKRVLAENIRQNIYDLGMTQAKYAKEIGIPIATLEYAISKLIKKEPPMVAPRDVLNKNIIA